MQFSRPQWICPNERGEMTSVEGLVVGKQGGGISTRPEMQTDKTDIHSRSPLQQQNCPHCMQQATHQETWRVRFSVDESVIHTEPQIQRTQVHRLPKK